MVPSAGVAACGVEFCSDDANLLAVASADCSAYIYDLRNRYRHFLEKIIDVLKIVLAAILSPFLLL